MYQLCIVCPHRLIREALREIVRKSPAVVVGEGKDLSEVLERLGEETSLDLAVFNLDLGRYADAELAQIAETRRLFPTVKIVVLTDAPAPETAMRAVRAGIHALLSRDIPSDILQKALHFVMLGQILLPAAMAKLIVEDGFAAGQETAPTPVVAAAPSRVPEAPVMVAAPDDAVPGVPVPGRASHLSERESQILQCLVKGFSNKIIARRLSLAEATVKVHIKSVLRKLQATNRTQAAVWALNNRPFLERLPDDAVAAAPPVRVKDLECT